MRQAQPAVNIDYGDGESPVTQVAVDFSREVALAAPIDAAYCNQRAASRVDLSLRGRNPGDRRLHRKL
jgi:hypothetical protein